jgi:hypothetical protein
MQKETHNEELQNLYSSRYIFWEINKGRNSRNK